MTKEDKNKYTLPSEHEIPLKDLFKPSGYGPEMTSDLSCPCPFCGIEFQLDVDHLALATHIANATDDRHHRNHLGIEIEKLSKELIAEKYLKDSEIIPKQKIREIITELENECKYIVEDYKPSQEMHERVYIIQVKIDELKNLLGNE